MGRFDFPGAVDDEQPTIWRSENGFYVVLMATIPLYFEHSIGIDYRGTPELVSDRAVYCAVGGQCSSAALAAFREEIDRVLRTILMSLECLNDRSLRNAQPRRSVIILGTSANKDYRSIGLLLDAYYSNPTKKDSIDRRMRNALHLLVHADLQQQHAIGIALCVSAVEALVCKKGSDIANMFAENVAALLEPDPRLRSAAFGFLKKLYGARSETLHGALIEQESGTRDNARVLAAAVLHALLERRDFMRRAGMDSETPDELLMELREGKYLPGQLTGVSESPVRDLWGWVPDLDESTPQED